MQSGYEGKLHGNIRFHTTQLKKQHGKQLKEYNTCTNPGQYGTQSSQQHFQRIHTGDFFLVQSHENKGPHFLLPQIQKHVGRIPEKAEDEKQQHDNHRDQNHITELLILFSHDFQQSGIH